MPHTPQTNQFQEESFTTIEHAELLTGSMELLNGFDTTKAIINADGVADPVAPNNGAMRISGLFSGGTDHIETDGSGRILTTTIGVPGTVITTSADVAVGTSATVALTVPPAGTRRMRIQNTGPTGVLIRVREVGAGAGRGEILTRFGVTSYGESGGAIAALEVEEVASPAVATTVMIQFEG